MRKPQRVWVLCTILLLAVTACTSGTGPALQPEGESTPPGNSLTSSTSPDLAGGQPATPESIFPILDHQPNPVTITANVDDETRITGEVTADLGGVLSMTTADGVQITLEVPPNAVREAQTLQMTALSTVEGFPFSGGLVSGLVFEPAGLRFLEPAWLTIQLPHDLQPQEPIGFAFGPDGVDFHLYPTWLKDDQVKLPVLHFSGYGVGAGANEEAAAQAQRGPSQAEAHAEQQIAQVLTEEAQRMAADPETSFSESAKAKLYKILKHWFDSWILPQLQKTATDDRSLGEISGEYLSWERWGALLGLQEDFWEQRHQALDSLAAGIAKTMEQSHRRCVNENDPGEYFHMQQWQAFSDLMGITERHPDLDSFKLTERIIKCTTFETDFESFYGGNSSLGPASGSQEALVQAQDIPTPLLLHAQLGAADPNKPGEGPLIYVRHDVSGTLTWADGSQCVTEGAVTSDSTFQALASVNISPPKSEAWRPLPPGGVRQTSDGREEAKTPNGEDRQADVMLWFDPGNPGETITSQCDSFGTITNDDNWWRDVYGMLHVLEENEEAPLIFEIEMERKQEGDLYAEKKYEECSESTGDLAYKACEKTIIQLRHAPQR